MFQLDKVYKDCYLKFSMDKMRIIAIVVGLIILIGAFVGLMVISNVTGNVITGGSVNSMVVEEESFRIDEANNLGVEDDLQNSS